MDTFDIEKAKQHLKARESQNKEKDESKRKELLDTVITYVRNTFAHTDVEVYLVGSIIQPFQFHERSDIDIVLKNFKGDRFDLWTQLETVSKRNVEVVIFENCPFQKHVITHGYKVV